MGQARRPAVLKREDADAWRATPSRNRVMTMTSIQSIVDRQIQRWLLESRSGHEKAAGQPAPRPVITISRTLGSGGALIGRLVAERMKLNLYEKEIIEQIAAHGEVRRDLVEAMDEHSRSRVESWVDGILRNRMFDEGDYYHHLLQVLRSLQELGSVVIVGRGANFILPERPALHVRVVAPLEDRVRRLMDYLGLTRDEAEKRIRESDANRARFVRRLFGADWNDPLHYNLVINTGRVCLECSAMLVETAWTIRMRKHLEEGEKGRGAERA